MTRLAPTPNPYLAIDRLLAVRRALAVLQAEEATLVAAVQLLPDGHHDGCAGTVDLVTTVRGGREIRIVSDALAHGAPQDAPGFALIAPVQMG